ncbi:hypothetical protein MMC08_004388 [Hypocenomyce scalaris]|nr:hypothetical protein [Hypocenomyce scalaris]
MPEPLCHPRLAELRQLIVQGFEQINLRMMAMENNNSARVANSTLRTANQQLEPLVNRDTNELIDDFPHTPEDIRGMNGMQDWTLAGYKQTSAVGRS